ncbi:hypothetical protein C1I98_03015 [Spongiactinospora gelatinilytica]|uniref:DUF11 domain-containing protein n=2 Tax=Spongiactinospora gelatinilytica TaxID=2666298 RepID=A0A2W2J262_9ACTN|nr:hypothetical protein C1I98_03015 [Spongiactinospora gelatinilytica]
MAFLPDAAQNQPNSVPGWRTTASDHVIEVWRDGFNGVPAADGRQFAELNAHQVSTLYQDLPTTPGTTLYWRLSHRGRLGADTMALDIGHPEDPVEQARMTDGNDAWGHYSGKYTVPDGQTVTRFAFRSVSAAGGNNSIGNFLDGIVFGTAPSVVLTKSAVPGGELEVGDTITYRVTARNEGGSPASRLVLTDTVPEGTSYVPGSLRIIDGPNEGGKSDRVGDDQAYVDEATGRVTFNLGVGATDSAGGTLASTQEAPEGTTVEFRVRIERAAAGRTIENQAVATYDNALGDEVEHLTSTSNPTATKIAPLAELRLVKAADRVKVTVGETVTFHVAVTNTGPSDATGVTVTDPLPEGLALISATATAGGYDAASGTWTVGALSVGQSATLTLLAKVTEPGPIRNAATATANEAGPTGDAADEVTICAVPAAPCPPPGANGCHSRPC